MSNKKIAKKNSVSEKRLKVVDSSKLSTNKCVIFSFERLENNEYFNLDGTCVNWSSDLFIVLKEVSAIEVKRILNGEFSGKNSKLRVHSHKEANPPCSLPNGIELDEFYQIRIGSSKGGIHGVLIDNIFYVVWLDPQHNMYPSENHGGLKKIKPPSTCCKERDNELIELKEIIEKLEKENLEYEELIYSEI